MKSNSTWDFRITEFDEPTELRKTPQRLYQYRFLVLKDKIIIE